MLYNFYFISLIVTFFCCLYAYKKLDKNFKWFLPYLAFIIVYESASIFRLLIWRHTNSWCMNVVMLMEFILFTYFLTSLVKKESYKKRVYFLASIVILLSLIDMIFIQGVWKLNTIAAVLQNLFILTLVFIYYSNLFAEAREHLVLLKHPPFLVATGLLFYFLSNTFFYSCFSYMAYKNNYHFLILTRTIMGLSNLLLNLLLIYAFLCFSKKRKAAVSSEY
jgi:hypothetical protein